MAPLSTPANAAAARSGAAVLVPVKAFARAKERLASELDPAARAALAKRMATGVVAAAAPLPVWVVCDDDDVAAWAASLGASVSWQPGSGLNGAVQAAVDELAGIGFQRVIVAHGDLPRATTLAWLAEPPTLTAADTVVLVPDSRGDGTNVASVPSAAGFQFAYGPGSCTRHVAEAERLGLPLVVRRHHDLQYDVDDPADLVFVPPLP
jgi:2-phospho-L-lactate guanylyltransferase